MTLNVKRFTVNTAIAKQRKLTDILYQKLFAAYRGFHTYRTDGKIQLRVERPTKSSPMVSAIASGATSLTTNLPYFAVGDSILLSPFTAQAEVRKVLTASAGTITFAAATYAHAAGAAVYQIAMAFDDANMIGTAAYPLQDRQGSVNRVVVKYTNPAAAFAEQVVHVNDYEHQAQIHRVNSVEVDGSAIDSFFQAYRIGQFQMRKFRELAKFVELRGNITASLLEIGDVIAVSAVECGLQCVPFRVIEVGFEENDEVAIVGQLYDVAAYDDTAPQTTVTVPAIFGTAVVGGGPGVAVPGDVTNLAGSWALGPEAADGGRLAVLTVTYDAPIPIDEFTGVRATYQVFNGPVIPAGLYEYPGPVTIEIPAPNPRKPVKVTLASRTAQYEKVTDGTTPSVTIYDVGGSLAAQNVASVTAVPIEDGPNWGISGVVTFGALRETIRYGELVIVGPYAIDGSVIPGITIERPWTTFIPPVSGTYSYSVEPSWLRGTANTKFKVVCNVYNFANILTAAPTESAQFTVTAVNQTTQATSVAAAVEPYPDHNGIWFWYPSLAWTNANDPDFYNTRIYLEELETVGFTYLPRKLYTETGPNGVGGGAAQVGPRQMVDAVMPASRNFRITFVTVNTGGDERPGAPTAFINVVSQAGVLNLARALSSSVGTALTVSSGSLRVANAGIDNNLMAAAAIYDANVAVGALLNGTKLADGTVASAKILSLVASKIAAGTVTASVLFTAPALIITSGSVTVNIDGSNRVLVADTAFTTNSQMTGSAIRLGSTTDGFRYVQLVRDAVQLQGSGGFNSSQLGLTSLSFNGNQVLAARGAAVANPTGGMIVDVECRATVSELLSRLRSTTGHGLISGSSL